jgi:chromosomal replication initiator protein
VFKDESTLLTALHDELRRQVGEHRYELWLSPPTEVVWQDGQVVVRCASQAARNWVQRNLRDALTQTCAAVVGSQSTWRIETLDDAPAPPLSQPTATATATTTLTTSSDSGSDGSSVAVSVVAPAQPARHARKTSAPAASSPRRRAAGAPAQPPSAVGDARQAEGPQQRWTFATYEQGAANHLAVQAARETLRHLGRYSPLVLAGPVGSGKTHLLRALASELRRGPLRHRVVELTAEQFMSQFLEALDRRQSPSFRQKFRTVDALLIDDVQFLAGKRATLGELLSTIDDIQQRGGQVVLACEGGPAQLQQFSPELASRSAAGLAVTLDLPDYELRLAIVEGIARRCELELGRGVAQLLAQRAVGSARLLSGALNRLAAVSMAEGRAIDRELAEQTLEAFCREHTPQFRLADIERAVCRVFGVEAASLKSSRKTHHVAQPRMLAMWLARKHTRAALSEIGEFFGRRSHSTVVSAQRKFDRLVSDGQEIRLGDRSCRVDEAVRRVEAALHAAG